MSVEKRCDTCVHWNNDVPGRPSIAVGHGLCAASGDLSTTNRSGLPMAAATATAYAKQDNTYGFERAHFETAPWHNCLMWTPKPKPPKKLP